MQGSRSLNAVAVGLAIGLVGSLALFSPMPASADEIIGTSGRHCFKVAGSPGDAAVVNLTPVLAQGSGNGLLVSSDVTSPPVAANVNYKTGTVDPNVAIGDHPPVGGLARFSYRVLPNNADRGGHPTSCAHS